MMEFLRISLFCFLGLLIGGSLVELVRILTKRKDYTIEKKTIITTVVVDLVLGLILAGIFSLVELWMEYN